MLEHVPGWLGGLLKDVRAGHSKLAAVRHDLGDRVFPLSSPAFAHGARLPIRFTADGAGTSPPLAWGPLPADTVSLALLVEDPDAPAPNPFVHATVWNIAPDLGGLAEGAIAPDRAGVVGETDVGRNSYLSEGWLPPDPPKGHGAHDYVFQLFALSRAPEVAANPCRSALLAAIHGNVLGIGFLIGTYSRDEPAGTDMFSAGLRPAGL